MIQLAGLSAQRQTDESREPLRIVHDLSQDRSHGSASPTDVGQMLQIAQDVGIDFDHHSFALSD